MQNRYPNRYNYEARLGAIERALRDINQLSHPEPGLRLSTREIEEPDPIPDLDPLPDTPTRDRGTPVNSSDTDGWNWSDYFFEDEGVVAAELPGESELNVSGRQSVRFNFKQTNFPNDPDRDDESNINVDQSLQFNVKGSVADELLVVDMQFNGNLPEVERQSIKVLYNGRERNVGFATSQTNMKFGDINLSLPGTNFVSYNKSVFGLRGKTELRDVNLFGWQPEQFTLYGVASQEEGQTQKKVFEGKNRRRIPEPIPDIQPIRRRYYQLLADTPEAGRPGIEVNSEQLFLDDQNQENNDDNTIDKTVSNGGDTYNGRFDELEPGDDYAIDYQSGVVRFKRNIQNNFVLAVSMTLEDGTNVTDFMFKDQNESDTFDRYHLRNRYQLAGRNLVRNDPDRELEVRDSSNEAAPDNNPSNTYNEILGVDRNSDGTIDDEFIDFELGVLRFPDTRPFDTVALSNNGADTNPTVYGPPADRVEQYNIYQEVLVRENIYQLDLNVVRGSEDITVDGQSLVRNRDYTIDYQTGFVRFFDRVDIDEESRIEVTFESKSLGNQQDETFLGGRLEADISENLQFGSTFLSDQEDELGRVPQVGEETQSTLVNEFDMSWNPFHTTQDILADWFGYETLSDHPFDDHLQFDLNAEWASSSREVNQQGRATVDDFQNLDKRARISKDKLDWSPADPAQQFPGTQSVLSNRSPVEFEEQDGEGFDPDPDNEDEDEQTSLKVNVQPNDSQDTWTSFQQLFSENGRDLRGYQYLEFWVNWKGNTENGTMTVDLGRVSEDVNRDGTIQTEDENGDDVLNPGEDNGYRVNPGGGFQFGANNGVLNSEDLDRNGFLNQEESYLHFPNINKSSQVDTKTTSHGWTRYRIPLNPEVVGELRGDANSRGQNVSDTPSLEETLRNVDTVRMTYETPGGSSNRQFLIDQLAVVRTTWQTPSDTDTFSLDVVSEAEESNRLPAPGSSSFSGAESNILEQALGISYSALTPGDSDFSTTFLNQPSADRIDFYGELNLLINTAEAGSTPPDTGFLRFGLDEDNFFQYSFDLDNPGGDRWIEPLAGGGGNWFQLSIDLRELENDLIQKTLNEQDVFRDGGKLIRGSPSLREINRYRLGLIGPSGGTSNGNILFELLHVGNAIEEEGDAVQLGSNINVRNGLIDLNLNKRNVDGDFRTIGLVNSATANRFVQKDEESRSVGGSIDINRYIPSSWGINIPFSFDWSDQTTELPADRAERVRNEELGKVENESLSWSTGLNTPGLYPDFNFNWSEQTKNVDQTQRNERWSRDKENWKLGSNYSLSFSDPIFGVVPVGNSISLSTDGSIENATELRNVDTGSTKERDRESESRRFNLSLDFRPADWLNFSPGYQFKDRNRRTLQSEGLDFKNQSYDFSLKLDPGKYLGFNPSYDLSVSGSEQFTSDNFSTRNTTISLNGNSNFQINTEPTKWSEYLQFLSLTYNYSVSNSANYDDVPGNTNILDTYSDFFNGVTWILTGADLEVQDNPLSLSRNRGSFQSNHRLSGNLDLWDPVDISYNVQISENKGQSDNSVNRSSASSYSLNNRFELRKLSDWFHAYTNSASFKLNYGFKTSESGDQTDQNHDIQMGLNTRWNKWWSTNANLNTSLGESEDENVATESLQINPSLDFTWLVNESEEGGLIWFDNRFEINGGISGSINERTRNGETRADDWEVSGNMGGAYNFSEWIKTRFSLNYSTFKDNFREANDKTSYGANASVDFRF